MNKSLLTLIAAKTLKHITFITYSPFSGYVSKELTSVHEISEGRIVFKGQNMEMSVIEAQCSIIATGDRQVEVAIEGNRDTFFLSW